ncbi:MAG: carbohydrate porin [Beijerinckiaceae bacterium]
MIGTRSSKYSQACFNASFGWPNIFAANMPSGGPNYPMATPGIRLKVSPSDQIAFQAALFNGDPPGAGFTGLQEILDLSGINFRLIGCFENHARFRSKLSKDAGGVKTGHGAVSQRPTRVRDRGYGRD